jgi:hypothetical protein
MDISKPSDALFFDKEDKNMGQYYSPVLIAPDKRVLSLCSYDFQVG